MNKYDVIQVVGEGAYGVVLKCQNKNTGEIVAVKKFKETEDDKIVRKTTVREVKMLRMLQHENVVELKEAFKRNKKLYLVFEYIDKNLLEFAEEHNNLPNIKIVKVLIYQLIKALEYCHDNNIIHRDIKPENILVNSLNLHLKICDFGFARPIGNDTVMPLTDYVATRWYRAPELLVGDGIYGKEIDIWSVGCIMGELIDGEPLFPGDTELVQLQMLQKVLGSLTGKQIEALHNNPRFYGTNFHVHGVDKFSTLDYRYIGKLSKQGINFMKGCLHVDPAKRITAKEAMRHPFFEDIASSYNDTCTPTNAIPTNNTASATLMTSTCNVHNNNNTYVPAKQTHAHQTHGQSTYNHVSYNHLPQNYSSQVHPLMHIPAPMGHMAQQSHYGSSSQMNVQGYDERDNNKELPIVHEDSKGGIFNNYTENFPDLKSNLDDGKKKKKEVIKGKKKEVNEDTSANWASKNYPCFVLPTKNALSRGPLPSFENSFKSSKQIYAINGKKKQSHLPKIS